MARASSTKVDERALTKGQLRKLNALRKSVGSEIGERAFTEWLSQQKAAKPSDRDRNAELIAESLWPLIEQKKLKIRPGGYLLRRGRGRIIVEAAKKS